MEMQKLDTNPITKIPEVVGADPGEMHSLRLVIATRGDAYTGKTTCADAIARSFRCSVLRLDDILDSLCPSDTDDVAFEVVVCLARSQLMISRPVVVDSPLTRRSHLDRLAGLAEELQCAFVIVECRPEVKYVWKLRFEKRSADHDMWYKPKEWKHVRPSTPVEQLIDLPNFVYKLKVDTTDYVNLRHLGPAVFDLVMRYPMGALVDFRDWMPINPVDPGFGFLKHPEPESTLYADHECGVDGRHLLLEVSASLHNCRACQGTIDSPRAYSCKRCNLVLHKSCAELQEKAMLLPHQIPPFFRKAQTTVSDDSVLQEYRRICHSCKASGNEFSTDCEFCLWEMHLRSGSVPTLLRHESHPAHSLCLWMTSALNPREYQCAACKLPGGFAGYTCNEGRPFTFILHVECALLPRPAKHVHGGYEHDMRLVMGTRNVQEDYLCDVCGGERDPSAWYYYCDHCVFVSHLHCVYASEST